jgi:hypothetical protein
VRAVRRHRQNAAHASVTTHPCGTCSKQSARAPGVREPPRFAPKADSERSPLHDVRQRASSASGRGMRILIHFRTSHRVCHSKRQTRATSTADGFTGTTTSHRSGGARRDRTDDLLLAKQALSQLSYGPFRGQQSDISNQKMRHLITDIRSLIPEIGGPGKT